MRKLSTKAGLVIGSVLALSLFFNSVVYACSKLSLVMPLHGSSMGTTDGMTGGSVEKGPCAEHKQDICKTVRDRMLSIQPSLYRSDVQQPFLMPLPAALPVGIPTHIVSAVRPMTWQTDFHSVFKLPLSLSLSVLRI